MKQETSCHPNCGIEYRTPWRSVFTPFFQFIEWLRRLDSKERGSRQLRALDDRYLRDIGVERLDVDWQSELRKLQRLRDTFFHRH